MGKNGDSSVSATPTAADIIPPPAADEDPSMSTPSTTTTTTATTVAANADDHENDDEIGEFREQDRLLPIANVGRIMKMAVPPAAKISKDAKESVQECVSEFITAAERCLQEKRKTINGEDIVWALEQLGFDQYSAIMKIYLQRYKEYMKMGTGIPQSATQDSIGNTIEAVDSNSAMKKGGLDKNNDDDDGTGSNADDDIGRDLPSAPLFFGATASADKVLLSSSSSPPQPRP